MSSTTQELPHSGAAPGAGVRGRSKLGGRWIDDWRPEDPAFWSSIGRRVANRNLWFSVATEHIGFSVWSLWSVMVLFMGPTYHVDAAGKFLLTALPTLVGSVLRIPYTFAVARFGGRNFTIASALLLLIPCIFIAVVMSPGVSYSTLLIAAATAGVGGGNFASSMTNINSFYPAKEKGWALGLNAGGGNLGVAVVQLVALLVLATAGASHPRVMVAIYIPLIVLGALGAALTMDNLTVASNAKGAMRRVSKDAHTWIIALLYIGTFGSFIGFGFAFGQVLQVQFTGTFSTPVKAAYLTFLGPLIGSLIRPVGGRLADRFGGASVSFFNFVLMAVSTAVVLGGSLSKSLPVYLIGFVLLFAFSGVGNGSVYKMIPAIFRSKASRKVAAGAEPGQTHAEAHRLSGALIGIAGAIGAFGGVLVNLAFRSSFLAYKNANAAFVAFIAFYVLCLVVTWAVYLRRSPARLEGV
ncbi:MFS transporter [Nakamurella endophytica]|uniref:MFS transporter n=1 Tax=Nakamurella endophytica TaxID=1748367 RepID=A0A917SN21_9ACTN|nr:MFS transporter [Nakamurella endophytica]GGL90065.1 MFS transporter [Nakamurella endophytica]